MFPSVLTLCLLCLSLQRNSSLSGSTRGMYQVSERRSSPSTGWVSNTLLVQSCTLDTPWDISFYHWTIKSFIKQVMRYTGNRTRRWDADRQKWQKASLHWSKNKTKHKQHNKWLVEKPRPNTRPGGWQGESKRNSHSTGQIKHRWKLWRWGSQSQRRIRIKRRWKKIRASGGKK